VNLTYNSKRLFLSSAGKNSLKELGVKDKDVFIADITIDNSLTTTTRKNNNSKANSSTKKKNKKNRLKAKQKNKPREQIVIPKTEEELRKDHSTMLSPVLEELERVKLRDIRKKLNDLSLKKTEVKDRKLALPKRAKEANDELVFNPPTDGLEGKAGKVFFPVIVGNVEHLYRSSKKSKVQRNQTISTIDLHGLTADEATLKLNQELPALVDAAMKEETFTAPVDIVCGGGGQVLAEVVEQWIRTTRQVANRPKGF